MGLCLLLGRRRRRGGGILRGDLVLAFSRGLGALLMFESFRYMLLYYTGHFQGLIQYENIHRQLSGPLSLFQGVFLK
jgi:hypothetical protein